MVKIVLDVMGGDYAPYDIMLGGLKALDKDKRVFLKMVGKEELIKEFLKDKNYDKSRLEIVNATEVIETVEPPVMAIRTKKDSSIVVGLGLLKNNEADAFVSAGSTGAVLVGAQVIAGKVKGVKRAPLAPLIPTNKGVSLLIDCGANVDARSEHLLQFAKMGSIYMEQVIGIKNPKVGLVNIGAEEEKGNALIKETFPMLKECRDINFIGSIEARDIPNGDADVIVCEAFVGNVILKLYEGLGMTFMKKIKYALTKSIKTKLGALLIKSSLKETFRDFDVSEYGGAPLLGLNGIVVKVHGNSKETEVCNAIIQCVNYKENSVDELIKKAFYSLNG